MGEFLINVEMKAHYAFVTRLLIDLYTQGKLPNIRDVHLEPEYGHVGRIVYHDGTIRIYRGGRTGINPHGATLLARDKGYSKYFMRELGYNTADWQTFVTTDYARRIQENLSRRGFTDPNTNDKVLSYIHEQLGYPVYLKLNESSQGKGVFRCESDDNVRDAITYFDDERADVFIVEASILYPDYRVVVYHNQVIAAYHRQPFSIIGDGEKTIRHLITEAQNNFYTQGRKATITPDDSRMIAKLTQAQRTLDDILPEHEMIVLYDVANLSLGGSMRDVTDEFHSHWQELCINLTRDMGLNLCGVDIACADTSNPEADYAIIEINAAPGMENYASLGDKQMTRIRELYRDIFNNFQMTITQRETN